PLLFRQSVGPCPPLQWRKGRPVGRIDRCRNVLSGESRSVPYHKVYTKILLMPFGFFSFKCIITLIVNYRTTSTLCTALFILTCCLYAQRQERGGTVDLVHLERHQFRWDLLGPGLNYELGLFKNESISTGLGLSTAT